MVYSNIHTDKDIFSDLIALKEISCSSYYKRKEPTSTFPLKYYEFFLQEIKRLDIETVTYQDLFKNSSDWSYTSNYIKEYENWKQNRCNPNKTYLLIQHDIDNHPFFTKRMVALEALYGIRSNIFMFRHRYSRKSQNGIDKLYEIDHEFFKQAEYNGYIIGYHQNALPLSDFNLQKATERYRSDVNFLRKKYNINFVVPHGGQGTIINGKPVYNVDVPMPKEFEYNLRWVFNRYGVKFDGKWSDGGLRKERDIKRIRNFDLVRSFLYKMKKGNRYFCLVHPQRWGFNIDMHINPILAQEKWYQEICNYG